ncbi:glycosyltransferase [Pseudonocardia parietis]|uniref:Glycosyltransferase involved in cell wall biosynthesis n=1 Tax=Pseudonocardia parietis TaxID=570936 RepID=A0ABS4VL90_9PSEU|nr:glycosyltransferase [Pseudonocardia parietis]MBP2364687.1 glycosyltransferase involved in cell wall biosynthesis [Pseudonocardia parietis]
MSAPSVLHVNDAAFTAARMTTEAHRRGLEWDLLPKAAPAQQWPGVSGRLRRAMIGGRWVARLAVKAWRHDIVHVHSASTVAHSRLGAPRYVVHCHGTDVRTAQYDPRRGPAVVRALERAEAVLYSTPDLAEHVLQHRPDAVYLPVPIDVDAVPGWYPAPGRPRIVFASRWSRDKGVEVQLAVARDLAARMGDRVDLVGLDWGSCTADAAASGVRLVPRTGHSDYLGLLAGASVVVGQSAGILAASELEALAAGAPVVVPVPLPLYENPPVLAVAASDAADAVAAVLDGDHGHDPVGVRRWTRDTHGVVQAVDSVQEVHRRVLAARG